MNVITNLLLCFKHVVILFSKTPVLVLCQAVPIGLFNQFTEQISIIIIQSIIQILCNLFNI